MSKRILFLFPLARYMRAHWTDRIRACVAQGYDVHIGVPFDDDLKSIGLHNAKLHDLPLRRGMPALMAEISCFLSIRNLIRELKPDILHAITIRPVAYGGILAKHMRVPAAIYSLTGLGFLYASSRFVARSLRSIVEHLLRYAFAHPNARVLFENPDDSDELVARNILLPEKSSVFIGSGLNLDAFAFTPPPDAAVPLIALPSRLIVPKGVHEFVSAARLLKSQGVVARFALVGEGDKGNPDSIDIATLEAWSHEGVVEVWGWQDDIAAVLRASAVICLPTYYREGAPRILIEAAAIGRPVVTTDWPGCRDVVVDHVTGLLVPPRDVVTLANALRTLIADADRRRDMGLAARAHAQAKFSNERAIAHLLSLYEDVFGNILRND
ncbi:MAG: glycosyltransferase family 4 protein [Parvibaculum sp.]|nr:glycosyltransferase family 4 protein [Parvibaculum sp.]